MFVLDVKKGKQCCNLRLAGIKTVLICTHYEMSSEVFHVKKFSATVAGSVDCDET